MSDFFKREIALAKLFGTKLSPPNKDNAVDWAARIYGKLEPENLTCDGECSPGEVRAREAELLKALAICEKALGRKITNEEVFQLMMDSINKLNKKNKKDK